MRRKVMKAVVCTKFGFDGLKLEETQKPVPADDEVLVKIYASSVNYNILAYASGKPYLARLMGVGLFKPKVKIPGGDIAGRVEAVGKNVISFRPGNEVFGNTDGFGYGAFAEYAAVPEKVLTLKPANMSFAEAAAAIQSSTVALQALRYEGRLLLGKKVLIYGASGGIGSFAVQIAKAMGAEVTGVCSTANLELVRSLGADHVIDYTKEDFTKNGERYDRIVATAGYNSIFAYKRALNQFGVYVMVGGAMKGRNGMAQVIQALIFGPLLSSRTGRKLGSLTAKSSKKDLVYVKRLIESGKVRPLIDRSFPLIEVPAALKYYEERHARGKVVITMSS
jgi:NADPH:quinone reductase-like Zn-dependent oxidoreductase